MAKRKITVTVDSELVDEARRLGVETMSSVVNDALAAQIERLARRDALRDQLTAWDAAFGPVTDEELAAARAVFDDADAVGARAAS